MSFHCQILQENVRYCKHMCIVYACWVFFSVLCGSLWFHWCSLRKCRRPSYANGGARSRQTVLDLLGRSCPSPRRCGAGFPVDDAAQFLIGTIKITNFDPTSRPVLASGNFAMFDPFTNQVCWDLASSWFWFEAKDFSLIACPETGLLLCIVWVFTWFVDVCGMRMHAVHRGRPPALGPIQGFRKMCMCVEQWQPLRHGLPVAKHVRKISTDWNVAFLPGLCSWWHGSFCLSHDWKRPTGADTPLTIDIPFQWPPHPIPKGSKRSVRAMSRQLLFSSWWAMA